MSDDGTAQSFSRLGQELDTPMFIVTVRAGAQRAGCLIGFATQVSVHPGRFLACISVKNHTHRIASAAETVAVHVVPESQRELAELFGGETGDQLDKFERCAWHSAPDGTPLLDGCPDRFVGRVLERLDLGDHTGYLLEPVHAHYVGERRQLSLRRAIEIHPGHQA